MTFNSETRAVATLAMCQLLWTSAGAITLTLGGIVGLELTTNETLATLAPAMMTLVAAITSFPASILLRRLGPRPAFLIGSAFGCLSGVVAATGIHLESFGLFCAGVGLWGVALAFGQFFRYIAGEAVRPSAKGYAISIVIASSVIAVIIGPLVAIWTQDWVLPGLYAGPYLAMGLLSLLLVVAVATLSIKPPPGAPVQPAAAPRPNSEPMRFQWEPIIIAGIASGVVGYAVMVFIMTAAPLAVVDTGFHLHHAASVVQWHLLGMYAPSLVSGFLISRYGEPRTIFMGIFLLVCSSIVALHGMSFTHFWVSLLLLGIGWNFMFIASTSLLAGVTDPARRARAQAVCETSIWVVVTVTALSAGGLLLKTGWVAINIMVLPVLLIPVVTTLHYTMAKRASRAPA